MIKRIFASVLVAASLGLAACDAADPIGPGNSAPANLMMPVEPGDGGGGGGWGGGDEGGGGTPPADQYRITQVLYRDRIDEGDYGGSGYRFVMKAYTQYERNVGGNWQRVNASNISITCYADGVQVDHETENNASRVDLTFGVRYQINRVVTCNHSANNGAYTATSTYVIYGL